MATRIVKADDAPEGVIHLSVGNDEFVVGGDDEAVTDSAAVIEFARAHEFFDVVVDDDTPADERPPETSTVPEGEAPPHTLGEETEEAGY